MSISPKFISINSSNYGSAVVISKEFLGEFLIYKVSINGETLRVRSDINNVINIGQRCSLKLNKDCYYFLYPTAQKIYI